MCHLSAQDTTSTGYWCYATAQSLPRGSELLAQYTANPKRAVYRLYPDYSLPVGPRDCPSSYQDIAIEPYACAVLPGLVAVLLFTRFGVTLSAAEAHELVAVSNYYKFSLGVAGARGHKDLNPNKLADGDAYWELNDDLVAEEVGELSPHTVITFPGRHVGALRQLGAEVVVVNDPAWILYGAGGALTRGGSWYEEAGHVHSQTARGLAAEYASHALGKYGPKKGQVEIYLLHYFQQWSASGEEAG